MVLEERVSGTGLPDERRTYGWGAAGLAYAVDATGAVAVYHAGGLGSVRTITDAAGTVVQTYQTDAFGVPVAAGTQGSRRQPFQWTGEEQDIPSWRLSGQVCGRGRLPPRRRTAVEGMLVKL